MDENKYISEEERLQRLMDMLEAGHELSEEEVETLLSDKTSLQVYQEVLTAQNAIMQAEGTDIPDAKEEWKQLEARLNPMPTDNTPSPKSLPKRKSVFLWGTVTGMVATILMVLVFAWVHKYMEANTAYVAYEMKTGIQNIVLDAGNGQTIVLDEEAQSTETFSKLNCMLNKKDTLELEYTQQAVEEEVQMHQLTTPCGHDFKLILADGTTVWLNAESRLEYPSRFTGGQRVVSLYGEAYFKVAKDAEHPFVIRGNKLNAHVTGTELNVRNYDNAESHITLVEGRVKVGCVGRGEFVELHPGEEARLIGDTLRITEVDTDYYKYWKDGYNYFDGALLVDIMQSIGRWYNVNVVFEDKKKADVRVRFFFKRHSSVDEAIENLNKMKAFTVRQEDNTIYIK